MGQTPFYESDADVGNRLSLFYDESNRVPPHFHSSMELVFVCTGEYRVIIDGEEKLLHPGEIAVADGFDVHCYFRDVPAGVYVAVISAQLLNDFRRGRETTLEKFLPKCEGTREIFSYVKCACEGGVCRNELMAQGFVTYLLGLLTHFYSCTRKRGGESARGVRFLSYIDEHYAERLDLHTLAEVFGYTPPYFSTLFKQYTGMGLREYVNRVRIRKSLLLRDGKRTVSGIASLCGFDSLNTYYRALKRYGDERISEDLTQDS